MSRFRRLGLFLAAIMTAAVSVALVVGAQQSPGKYKGRQIADVMSFHGAPWLERESRMAEERPDLLMDALPVEKGDTVVDLGCGSGFYGRLLAEKVGPEGRVLCVDIQPEMLEIAQNLAQRAGIENLETVLATETDPKLGVDSVDLILLVDVYHEMSQPEPVLEKLRQAVRPSGRVALVEFRLEGQSAAHIKIDHRMSKKQVNREWLPAGFELVELIESLPTQHLFLFAKKAS